MTPTVGFAGMTHLGICSSVAVAARGFPTVCFDADPGLIADLRNGRPPVIEPDLPEMLAGNRESLHFTSDAGDLASCDIVYISADVPTDEVGESDLTAIDALIADVIRHLSPKAILVVLCQVPPGFVRALPMPGDRLFYQVETLIFGRAIERATTPERFIVGCAEAGRPLPAAYLTLLEAFGCPILSMRYESAELTKIAINCFLVASVSATNSLAEICEHIGADWSEMVPALRLDKRIGKHAYLSPGLGIAGGNLERDLATVRRLARQNATDGGVVAAWVENSRHRRDWVARILARELPAADRASVVAILGLAYKANTHSIKNSPAVALVNDLRGRRVRVFDPVVSAAVVPGAEPAQSAIDAMNGADALALMTPWQEFQDIEIPQIARAMKGRLVIDPYGVLDGAVVAKCGLDYFSLGVPPRRAGDQEDPANRKI